ncbi:hypothetical protein PYW08_005599 [Mythimna loreyi]|uniref:Uncharacterized protein n=1 Tax=Mythimna loreyi TaxID=667449 RepID=A0ACC2QL38_9NEOP|nr:hypothetical protein PYW08_005599 [Mythimna loreyi]
MIAVNFHESDASACGCKRLRQCYEDMLNTLMDRDEAACIEDAAIGASTVTIFLKALREYCGRVLNLVSGEHMTYEGRHLYEVVLSASQSMSSNKQPVDDSKPKPIIIIEAGQQGGTEPVGLALYIVEQLVACEEYEDLLRRVTWVVLPCTNPDGQEYTRYSQVAWKKNLKPSDDQLSYGVDITRNFDIHWDGCEKVESTFSPIYPGPAKASENETKFIKAVIAKHKKMAKMYISLKRDGHSILYPYGYSETNSRNVSLLQRVAGEVALRVNQRTGGVHLFENMSIIDAEGKPHCGHAVDYAYDNGIPLAYEMRVFLGSDNKIMSKFQQMPRGYESSLRNGYFSGIRELFNVLTNEKKYGKVENLSL